MRPRRSSTTSRRSRPSRRCSSSAAPGTQRSARRRTRPALASSASPATLSTRALRAAARRDDPRADLRHRRRHPRGPRAEGDHPRRLVVPVHGRELDTPLDYDSLAAQGTFLGSGVGSRSTTAAAWCSSACASHSSTCTSRAASARPAVRDTVDGADPRADRGGRATLDELDLLLDVCDRILGKCLCPLGDAAAMPVASDVDKFRDEFREHVERGGCPLEGGVDARAPARSRSTNTRLRRCRAGGGRLMTSPEASPSRRRARRPGCRGTGIVETALAAGIEIPIFCYEPRLGAPVGACRMCLSSSRACRSFRPRCTLTARTGWSWDGAHSEKARRGPGGRCSSSSSSTIRSTARSATRAASARCRT